MKRREKVWIDVAAIITIDEVNRAIELNHALGDY
jgi:hypothetical protein